jgi:hypothetical protein
VAQLAALAPAAPSMAGHSAGVCPREALATFCKSGDAQGIVRALEALLVAAGVERRAEGGALLAPLHAALRPALNYSSGALFTALAARAAQPQYARAAGTRPLQAVVVGAGPIGLRSAVELALQGHAVPLLLTLTLPPTPTPQPQPPPPNPHLNLNPNPDPDPDQARRNRAREPRALLPPQRAAPVGVEPQPQP